MSRSKSMTGPFAVFIGWAPILALIVAVVWILALGLMHLEMNTNGSEIFVSNKATSNSGFQMQRNDGGTNGSSASTTSDMLDAYNSGDTDRMMSALDNAGVSVG